MNRGIGGIGMVPYLEAYADERLREGDTIGVDLGGDDRMHYRVMREDWLQRGAMGVSFNSLGPEVYYLDLLGMDRGWSKVEDEREEK